jgi:hypothetical protein
MRVLTYFLTLLFILGCKKEEELSKGTIGGKVETDDQYCYPVEDQAGSKVMLFHNTDLIDSTYTDSEGWYSFDNIPYGKYSISVKRDLFIELRGDNSFYHIGGYSPTLKNKYLFEIPTYHTKLDSMGYALEYILIYLHFNGDTLLPDNRCGMALRVFAGNTPDVTNNHFISCGKAFLANNYPGDYQNITVVHARIYRWDMDNNIEQLKQGTVFLRLYPIATGQGYGFYEYYPEALGPPSDVISFVWEDLVTEEW